MAGTKLDEIWKEMQRDNKEVYLCTWWYELSSFSTVNEEPSGKLVRETKKTTNSVLIDMKLVLINSLDEDIREQIEIWATITQITLKFCRQLGAITRLHLDWTSNTSRQKINFLTNQSGYLR